MRQVTQGALAEEQESPLGTLEGTRREGLPMVHYRLATAMDPTWKCRLRLHKQQGWEVRGICPFPTGAAALTLQWEAIEGGSSHSFYQIQGGPEILPRQRPELRPQHPAHRTPDPHFPPAYSGFGQDPPPGPQPRGNTEEDLGLTQDPKAKVEKVLDKTSGTPTLTSREPQEPVE